MALSPQKFREIVFQLIYSEDFASDTEVIEMLMGQLAVTKKTLREASVVRDRVFENREAIDEVIGSHSTSYALDRIPRIERNIIRLGIYELLIAKDLPPKVVLAEAIRLSRKFATPEAATFVNAVLDSILKKIENRPE